MLCHHMSPSWGLMVLHDFGKGAIVPTFAILVFEVILAPQTSWETLRNVTIYGELQGEI